MGIFLIVMQALALVPSLIEGYESAFRGKKKSGKAKKKLLIQTTKAGLDIAKVPPAEQTAILDSVSIITDATVAALNAVEKIQSETEPSDPSKK